MFYNKSESIEEKRVSEDSASTSACVYTLDLLDPASPLVLAHCENMQCIYQPPSPSLQRTTQRIGG